MHNDLSEPVAAIVGSRSATPTPDQFDALRMWLDQFPACEWSEVETGKDACRRLGTVAGNADGYDRLFCDRHAETLGIEDGEQKGNN